MAGFLPPTVCIYHPPCSLLPMQIKVHKTIELTKGALQEKHLPTSIMCKCKTYTRIWFSCVLWSMGVFSTDPSQHNLCIFWHVLCCFCSRARERWLASRSGYNIYLMTVCCNCISMLILCSKTPSQKKKKKLEVETSRRRLTISSSYLPRNAHDSQFA